MRTAAAVAALNLAAFIQVVSLPAFQRAHHHWIFPVLAALLAVEWAAASLLPGKVDRRMVRATLLSLLAFLLTMGIVRHATILACFDRCMFKLAAAAAIAVPVFLAHRFLRDPGFWDRDRSLLAALGAGLWAVFLALRGAHVAPWLMGSAFVALASVLWLGRSSAAFLIAAVGLLGALAIRAAANEYVMIGLGVLWGVAVPLAAVPKVRGWLERRSAAPPAPLSLRWKLARLAAIVAAVWGFAAWVAGPMSLVTDPAKRQAYLRAAAPAPRAQDPATLSPLAARLRAHTVFLAKEERDLGHPQRQEKVRRYILSELAAMGYKPKRLPFKTQWLGSGGDVEAVNIEAVLGHAPADRDKPWVLGAHYDTTSTTPGADDNASGVAVLLEAARLLRQASPRREVRFVAFDLEEPPAFGTRNMGSWRYARGLREGGVDIHGMVSLEMLGYFNDAPGSQLYPPFMQLFYPDRGDFVGVVSDWRSRGLMESFARAWRGFPLSRTVLPGPASALAMSDQLNFWDQGYPALMLSDTAFYRNPNYHEAGDTADTLDYERMAQVTRALARAVEAQ